MAYRSLTRDADCAPNRLANPLKELVLGGSWAAVAGVTWGIEDGMLRRGERLSSPLKGSFLFNPRLS